SHGDRDPARVGGVAGGREGGGEMLQGVGDLHLRAIVVTRTVEQGGQVSQVVGAEHDIDPGGPVHDDVLVLLRQASADRDLQAGVGVLPGAQVAECAVQAVVGVLAHGAGVEHHEIRYHAVLGVGLVVEGDVAGGIEHAGQSFRV